MLQLKHWRKYAVFVSPTIFTFQLLLVTISSGRSARFRFAYQRRRAEHRSSYADRSIFLTEIIEHLVVAGSFAQSVRRLILKLVLCWNCPIPSLRSANHFLPRVNSLNHGGRGRKKKKNLSLIYSRVWFCSVCQTRLSRFFDTHHFRRVHPA